MTTQPSLLKKLGTRSVIFVLADILQTGIGFLLIPLYTAFLSPADYGILAVMIAAGGVLGILFLQSLEAAFNRFSYDLPNDDERQAFYGSVWLFLIACTLSVSVILELCGTVTTALNFRDIPYRPYLQLVVWTTFVNNAALLLPRALFLFREEAWKYAGLSIALFTVSTLFIIYFVANEGQGVLGYLKGRLIGTVCVGVIGTAVVVRNIRIVWNTKYVSMSLRMAVPLIPHLLSLWILDLSDRFILQQYVSLEGVGVYAFGYQIASVLQLIAFALSNAISPFYYKTATDDPNAGAILGRLSTFYVLTLAWAGIGLVAVSQDVIKIVASQAGYYEAYKVVPWVVAGFCARGYYFVFVSALYQSKKLKALPLITILTGMLNIVLNIVLVPRFGYIAAGINTFVAYTVQAAVMYFVAQRAFHIEYEAGRLTFMTLFAVILSCLLYSFSLPNVWLDIIVKTAITAMFPVGLYLLNFYKDDEINVLRSLIFRRQSPWPAKLS